MHRIYLFLNAHDFSSKLFLTFNNVWVYEDVLIVPFYSNDTIIEMKQIPKSNSGPIFLLSSVDKLGNNP